MLGERVEKHTELDKIVTIVIPTFNEEEGIRKVLEELYSLGLRNILVVDGYSSDRTIDIARQFRAKVVFQHGKGKTGALKTARDTIDTPYMLVMDGDFTYDASCVSRLLQHMNSYDEVIGTRIYNAKSMNWLHKAGNRMISKVFNILMNTNLSDVCSGMYLLRTDSLREIDLATSGFEIEVEIAAQIASTGDVTEVPVNYRPRIGRQKLSTWRHGLKILCSTFGLAKSYNPGAFYSIMGSLLVIPAGMMLFYSLLEWTVDGRFSSPWFFLGISMLLVAIQSMGVGVISLILRRTELRSVRRLKKILPSLHRSSE